MLKIVLGLLFILTRQCPAEGRKTFEEQVQPWLKKNCMPCHLRVPPQIASTERDKAYEAAKKHTNFNKIEESSLVLKSKDAHCGKACKLDTEALMKALHYWAQKEKASSVSELPK